MPVESQDSFRAKKREQAWIKKYGETKSVKDWLIANPPPADFAGTPQQYAFCEMEEEPIDDPLLPEIPEEGEEIPVEAPVTRREHDELRNQVARVAKKFNSAIKRTRQVEPTNPPVVAPVPAVQPAPVARRGVAALLEPLKRNR